MHICWQLRKVLLALHAHLLGFILIITWVASRIDLYAIALRRHTLACYIAITLTRTTTASGWCRLRGWFCCICSRFSFSFLCSLGCVSSFSFFVVDDVIKICVLYNRLASTTIALLARMICKCLRFCANWGQDKNDKKSSNTCHSLMFLRKPLSAKAERGLKAYAILISKRR